MEVPLNRVVKKLARTSGVFFEVRYILPIDISVCLYNSLFSPFLQYVIFVWSLTYETHTSSLFLLQKRVVRVILSEHFTSPSTPIFSDLKIPELHDPFQLKLLGLLYDFINKICPSYFILSWS